MTAGEARRREGRSKRLEAQTSAQKRMRIDEEDCAPLREASCAALVASDRELLVFLEAILLAGLMPFEWEGAALCEGEAGKPAPGMALSKRFLAEGPA